jgi:hypothetical protein
MSSKTPLHRRQRRSLVTIGTTVVILQATIRMCNRALTDGSEFQRNRHKIDYYLIED